MDDLPARTHKGGIVEPGDRAAVAKATFQTPTTTAGPRFEMRDAGSDVVHHTSSFDEVVARADRVGKLRYTAIDANGRRGEVRKMDGTWQQAPGNRSQADLKSEAATVPSKTSAPGMPSTPSAAAKVVSRSDAETEREAQIARIDAALNERYVIKRAMVTVSDRPIGQTEYRFRGDTSRVAFIESTFRLATDVNSPSVARSMVDVAEARDWKALRVSGHEEFRRLVWLEGSLRGVRTVGYEPTPSDMAKLRDERENRQVNRIEPTPASRSAVATGKGSARGSGSRKTVLAAIEAVLVAQRVPEKRREAIMAAAADNLAKRLAAGEVHKVKVYDKSAPQQPVVRPAPEQQKVPERTTHVR